MHHNHQMHYTLLAPGEITMERIKGGSRRAGFLNPSKPNNWRGRVLHSIELAIAVLVALRVFLKHFGLAS